MVVVVNWCGVVVVVGVGCMRGLRWQRRRLDWGVCLDRPTDSPSRKKNG